MESWVQLLRYSIPGALFTLLGFFNLVIFDSAIKTSNAGALSSLADMPLVGITVLIVVGFVVYQVYYLIFEATNPPNRSAQLLLRVSQDPNLDVPLRAQVGHRFDDSRITLLVALGNVFKKRKHPDSNLVGRVRLELKGWRQADAEWSEHEALLAALSGELLTGEHADSRHSFSNLKVIYHSLGACRLACLLAFLGVVGFVSMSDSAELFKNWDQSLRAVAETGVVTAVVFVACHWNRADAREVAHQRLENAIRFRLAQRRVDEDRRSQP